MQNRIAMKAKRILDPRFEYMRSVDTDVAATWRRFGFKNGDPASRTVPASSIVNTPITRGMWIKGAAAVWASVLSKSTAVDGVNRS